MSGLSDVWDWSFFWGMFGFFMKSVSPFVMIPVAIISVGLLIAVIIRAVKGSK
jgi:hypothetical protein